MNTTSFFDFTIMAEIVQIALGLGFPIAILSYLAMRVREYPKPARWAMLAIGLVLVTRITWLLVSRITPRYFSVDQMPAIYAASSLVSQIMQIASTLLLIAAIFVDRKSSKPNYELDGSRESGSSDQNPYASPSSIRDTDQS